MAVQRNTPSAPTPILIPPWVAIALGEIGVVEDTRKGKSTRRIEEYHAVTRAGTAVDDVPWCASYVSWALEQAGVPSTRSKSASSYASWGAPCVGPDGKALFAVGSVLVFGKADIDAKGTGHVAFCLGAGGGLVYALGGNQGNAVSIAPRKAASVVAVRWPRVAPLPGLVPPRAA
jgi:uncharacterized protein (TIGR02594 family)